MENKTIPGYLLRKWEIAATKKNLSQHEFIEYIRDRQKEYFESSSISVSPNIMENGHLTKYGEKKAIEHFGNMNDVERAIKLIKIDYLEIISKIKKNKSIDENIAYDIKLCYNTLREKMQELRFKKEEFEKYKFNYNDLRRLYFSVQ